MGVELRRAGEADVAEVAAMHARSWGKAYADLLPDAYRVPWPGQDREERWRQVIGSRSKGLESVVAIRAGRIAGICVTLVPARDETDARSGEIAALYVEPDAWRSGIGTTLVENALTSLEASGRSRLSVWLFEGNDRVLGFYRAFGFEPDGASKEHPSGRREMRLLRR